MIAGLNQEEKQRFSNIIFTHNNAQAFNLVGRIENPEELIKIKKIYDQKIAFECAYDPIRPPKQKQNADVDDDFERPPIPSFFGTFCCCFYPEDNRDVFDITNEIFLKRFFSVFLFWRKNFLKVGGDKPDLYGPIWLIISYIILVGFMGNFSIYMVDSLGFEFMQGHYASVFGTVFMFMISEMLFYPAILSCLGGFISTRQSVSLLGYSIVLYFIPSVLCMFTSLAWYVTCMFGQGIIRAIFLFRNFSTRIEARTYVLLIVFLLVQFLYAYIMLQTVFFKYSGYTYTDGINQLTAQATVMNSTTIATLNHMLIRNYHD